ncbi:MAG: DUF3782 domain-containing protein [Candidatus Nitrosocaldaceae archaeon]
MQSNELKKLLDMLEEDKEFRYAVAGVIGYKEILDKFAYLEARMDERFAKIEEEIRDLREESNNLRKDMQEGFKSVDKVFERIALKITALGARWSITNEQSVREALKGIVGEELGYTISEWNAYDDEGYVYGYPSSIQLDIVVSNGKIIVIEIASHIKRSDSFMLKKKVELYKKKEGKEISKMMFVTPFIDDDARDACNRLGIEVYTA